MSTDATWQYAEWERAATDPRPRVSTGWVELDSYLYRQSFGPSTFGLLGGRLHTRKTAVMVNLIANMLQGGVPVGLVGLDESAYMYVAKLASVFKGQSHEFLEDSVFVQQLPNNLEQTYTTAAADFYMWTRKRPTLDELSAWLDMASIGRNRPRILFIDYLSLLARERFSGKDNDRIPRLCEDLADWTDQQELVTIALHQVGRTADTLARYHGATPVTPEQLMHGGEQAADIILATYRPSLDPIGNIPTEQEALAQGHKSDEWRLRRDRVIAFQQDTILQLIKNRPGTRLCPQGIRLRSVGDSQKMEVVPW